MGMEKTVLALASMVLALLLACGVVVAQRAVRSFEGS